MRLTMKADGDDDDNVADDTEADEHADMVNTANSDKEKLNL